MDLDIRQNSLIVKFSFINLHTLPPSLEGRLGAGFYLYEFSNGAFSPIAIESISWCVALGGHVDELILSISCFQNTHIRIRRNGSSTVCAFGGIVSTQVFQTGFANNWIENKNLLSLVFQKCGNGCHLSSTFHAGRIL